MSSASIALVLLAAALPLWSAAGVARARLNDISAAGARWWTVGLLDTRHTWLLPSMAAVSVGGLVGVLCGWPDGLPIGAVAAVAALLGTRRVLRGGRASVDAGAADQLGMAATWDLLAACLRAGLPVPTAVRAVATDLPQDAQDALRTTADLLALGADPVAAWAAALDCSATTSLARGARRTARSGTALAEIATAVAAGVRDTASDAAESKAQRAGVLITGPLGLCFLPAFICLGIVPVVVGLAAQLSVHQ